MINVAMISGWHVHAEGYAREINSTEGCAVTAIYDELPERGIAWAEKLGCRFVESYDDILSDSSIDAVAVCSATNLHADILLKAANAGKHIFTEKVLTLKLSDALKISEAVKANNIHFTISFPHKCRNTLQFAKEAVDSGILGTVTYARVRNCHSGSINNWLPPHFYNAEQCGGGAMVDLGAHPMYTLQWLLGNAVSVQSLFTNITDRPVEDNAVCLVEFEGGAIGVSETGFVSSNDKYTVDISGTKGAIHISDDDVTYCTKDGTNGEWIDAPIRQCDVPNPIKYWTDSIKNDSENVLFNIDDAVSLTALMEAAYKSYVSNSKAFL